MEYIHDIEEFCLTRPCAVTLGKFDGIHRGHQKLIEEVRREAEEKNLISAVFTFDGMPLSLVPQQEQHFLSTNYERHEILERLGIDVEVEYPFTESFMRMPPEEFIEKILVERMKAKVIVVGTDYCFGKDRAGNAKMLEDYAEKYGYKAIVMEKERYQNRIISSTYVREELMRGSMETVNALLGRPYTILGNVSMGSQIGRTIDMPTMNIYPSTRKLLPPNGVYASKSMFEGKTWYGVTDIGVRPTVGDGHQIRVETNLFDFEGDGEGYGKRLEVSLLHFLRSETKFDSLEALKAQMKQDAEFARKMFMMD